MRVRALDDHNDMQFGRGQADFLRNVPEAPAQCVKTRLGEYIGDWFLDTAAGTPWRTRVLGRFTDSTRDPAMRARILGTIGVTSISSYASQLNRATRGYAVQTNINTAYGATSLTVPVVAPPDRDVRYDR